VIALGAANPPGLTEITQGRPTARATGLERRRQRGVGIGTLLQCGQESAQRGVGHAHSRFDPLLLGALGAQADGTHVTLDDLCQTDDTLPLTAVAALHGETVSAPKLDSGASTPSLRVRMRSARPARARLCVTTTTAVRNSRASPAKRLCSCSA